MPLRIYADYLGMVPYREALRLQEKLAQARRANAISDVLLLLQHKPVFTLGRFRGKSEILVPMDVLEKGGIEVVQTNRGGSITYHGPGQMVGYPILNLKSYGMGVREYIRRLEEVIIRLLSAQGIQAQRNKAFPGGVWVDKHKICSIGIHVSHYISMHGFALNVDTNLRHFELIHPCGMHGSTMTSLSKLLGRRIEVEALVEPVMNAFAAGFGVKIEKGLPQCQAISADRTG